MTIKERSLLERMRGELHNYHIEVMQQAAKLETTIKTVGDIEVDLYGTPGDRDKNPGALKTLSSGVTDLRRSRKTMRLGLRGLWIVATMVMGSLIGWLIRG